MSASELQNPEPKRLLEAALLSSQEPLSVAQLRKLFENPEEGEQVPQLLNELQQEWEPRGVSLVQVASGWRFQSRPEWQEKISRINPDKPPRYSRSVLETLAIIAYRQPVTRGDIEDIRGVTVSTQIIRTLEARGWVEVLGHREAPGRPELLGTTKQFLDDLNLRTLAELPPLMDLQEDFNQAALTLPFVPEADDGQLLLDEIEGDHDSNQPEAS